MPAEVPNEFLTSINDNRIRPYTVGVVSHDETLASIILLTSDTDSYGGLGTADKNYLTDFSSRVSDLVSEPSIIGTGGVPAVPDGKIPRLTLDGKRSYYGVFNNFSLTSVGESQEQLIKVHQHFGGEWSAFFFGEKPRIYQFQGHFIDTKDYPYYQEFMIAYDKYLAGRKCIENKFQMKVTYSGRIISGFMINISVNHNAVTPSLKNFTFSVLVYGDHWLRNNMYRANIDQQGNFIWDRGYNVMSNTRRLQALSDQSAIEGQEQDPSGTTATTEQ